MALSEPVPGGRSPPATDRLPPPGIDREKVCPLLLRVFPKVGSHHRLEDFAKRGQEPKDELSMYTWPDASLRELTTLIKAAWAPASRPNAQLEFALVYPNRKGHSVLRVVGAVWASREGPDDAKTLAQSNFQTGDFLDVCVR